MLLFKTKLQHYYLLGNILSLEFKTERFYTCGFLGDFSCVCLCGECMYYPPNESFLPFAYQKFTQVTRGW
jgi:hypothetical protein